MDVQEQLAKQAEERQQRLAGLEQELQGRQQAVHSGKASLQVAT